MTGARMRVALSARGVEVDDGAGGVLAPWGDVDRVTAFALGTVRYVSFDLVNGHSVEVDDGAPEWDEMVAALPAHVDGGVDDLPAALAALAHDDPVLVVGAPVLPR
ncbi:hypothetical protein BJF88_10310 [Cellulosimicrobium sp. CUA-896]|nr:hypothetical protein [Cellulosimicrobium sp. CUA-896]OLT54150.1 hypothetical protein BJF88_10310 [Cellulosimicrobium sp. CUA-896]